MDNENIEAHIPLWEIIIGLMLEQYKEADGLIKELKMSKTGKRWKI